MPLPTNRDSISFNIQYQASDSKSTQLFGFVDPTNGYGTSETATWSHSFRPRFNNNASLAFSRNYSKSVPYFSGRTDIEQDLGIAGADTTSVDWGPPTLSFANFGSLSDGTYSLTRSQTTNFTDTITYVVQRKHNFTFGFGYRRMQNNALSYSNSRGSYSFSGLLTECRDLTPTSCLDASGQPIANTGFDFADFLLGYPASSSWRVGNSNNYFRGWAANAYAQDDYRVAPGLTLNLGLRYEYFAPYTNLYGHLSNLELNSAMNGVAQIVPGPSSGNPSSLIDPEDHNFSPRLGFAWKPSQKHSRVIRGGYSIFFSGSPYSQIAAQLAAQPPFAVTGSVSTSLTDPLTLQNGFTNAVSSTGSSIFSNTFAIDRNYKLAYAQTWSFAIQQTFPSNTLVELEYIGTKGTDLGTETAPNVLLPGGAYSIPNASNFLYQTSQGNSIFHAGQVRLTRRFSRGMSAAALYTFSKSIDDASSFTGLGGTVVQNPNDISAERGLSSFDQRNRFSLTYTLSSPVGVHGFWRNGDWKTKTFTGWTLNGMFTANSGTPLTALLGGTQVNSHGTGAVAQLRAEATGLPIEAAGDPYFNLLAFEKLPPGVAYGDAGVATIPGVFTTSLTAALNRAWRFGDARQGLQLRLSANNPMNHVQVTSFGTTVSTSSYGLPTGASAVRSVTLTLRYSF
jgi:hypothetical protein